MPTLLTKAPWSKRGKVFSSILGSCFTTLDAKLFKDAATLLPGYTSSLRLILCHLARWSLEDLSSQMHMSTGMLRRCLGYWLGQGVLKEECQDVYVVLEKNRGGQDVQG